MSLFVGVTLLAVLLYVTTAILSLRRNYLAARASGLRCIIVPFHLASIPWTIAQPLVLPLLNRLPESWTTPWLPFLSMDQCWSYGHDSFARAGTDTLIAVSWTGNILHTCDPEATGQMFKGNDFEKPAKLLEPLNLFGPTMTATERQETRLYRKVAAPFFNEATMRKVWDIALNDAEVLGRVFSGGDQGRVLKELRPTLAKMSLHVINGVCFEAEREIESELEFRAEAEQGHALSYSKAMHTVLENLRELFAIPKTVLNLISPGALEAREELNRYIEDLTENKKRDLVNEKAMGEPSLLDLLVGAGNGSSPVLPPAAIKGNIWLFMFAGHEANSNTLTFVILLLATHPQLQRAMQSDIDALGKSLSYGECYNAAMSSLPGAVINEALRLYSVIPFILKATWDKPQSITLANQPHTIPSDTLILVHTNATHRNPRLWPEPRAEDLGQGGMPYPVAAFNPEHWVGASEAKTGRSGFFKPQSGAYFPFSEGTRGCLGKKFALVELCAAVVRLFSEYSVELAVEGINSPEGSAAVIGDEEKQHRWQKARDRAEFEMSAGVEFNMSLRLTGEVPVRFVRRGTETFGKVDEKTKVA